MKAEATVQGTFFTDEELLPYHEVYRTHGEKWDITVKVGTSFEGHVRYIANAASDRPDRWAWGGPEPMTRSVMEIVAEMKAHIEHGPYEKSRAEIDAEMAAWAAANPEKYAAWQALEAEAEQEPEV